MGHPAASKQRIRSGDGGYSGRLRDGECPLVCLDETSKQLLADTRLPIAMKPGQPARRDYEYERNIRPARSLAARQSHRLAHRH